MKTLKTQKVTIRKMKNKKIKRQKKLKILHLDIWISSLIVKLKWRDYQVLADINLRQRTHGIGHQELFRLILGSLNSANQKLA